jgi:alkanesulfonate monooxygenase SsuD/methylene tetrahydromethanopterin reductase-like flavin-dependent oxidoreductase (luciferase family)
LYATFNIQKNREQAQDEGWQWMERFFGQPQAKIAYHFTVFGTPQECIELLRKYAAAGLTHVIARIASDDTREQSRMLLNEIRPALAAS